MESLYFRGSISQWSFTSLTYNDQICNISSAGLQYHEGRNLSWNMLSIHLAPMYKLEAIVWLWNALNRKLICIQYMQLKCLSINNVVTPLLISHVDKHVIRYTHPMYLSSPEIHRIRKILTLDWQLNIDRKWKPNYCTHTPSPLWFRSTSGRVELYHWTITGSVVKSREIDSYREWQISSFWVPYQHGENNLNITRRVRVTY